MALNAAEIQKALLEHGSVSKAAAALGIKYDTLKKRVQRLRARGDLRVDLRNTRACKRYVITSAQNNTPVHQPFLSTLQRYCQHNKAELLVIPVNYENITLTQKHGKDTKRWARELVPYLCDRRMLLNDNIMVVGDIKVNATNKHPLGGFETVTGKRSGIFGHGQLEMKVVPTPMSKLPKKLCTTGSVTKPNYSDSSKGKIAEENHCTGAVIVETYGDLFWVRQLRGNADGSFYDLDLKYTQDKVTPAEPALGLVCGDIHWDYVCPRVLKATFTSRTSMTRMLRPRQIVLHDVFDGYSGSHHHQKDPMLLYHKAVHGQDDVEAELERMVDGLRVMAQFPIVMVDSNHNRHFSRWLNECNPARDHTNAELYYRIRLEQVRQAKQTDNPRELMDPLEWYVKQKVPELDITFVGHDGGHSLGKYCIDNHGDIGANGVRGSAQQFTKFGGYYILGHSHTPGIYKNVIQVGTSSVLNMPYVRGPSSWMNTHAVVYADGNASLVDIVDGRWRA